MANRETTLIGQYARTDWAVLYLRVFAGAMLLLHNIGKIQNYNEIINAYPSWWIFSGPTLFVLVTGVEVLLAVLIISGMWVRTSAWILVIGTVVAMLCGNTGYEELEFVWLGIYVFLAIAGGGYYSFYRLQKPKKQ